MYYPLWLHGKTLIDRGRYGSTQPEIAPPYLYQIPIPVWDSLPSKIEKTYLQSKGLTELSKTRYTESQTLLLSETDRVGNEYLTLVLNSILTQEQINRDVGGSVILHWRPDQVAETIIPILPKKIQTEIEQKITESFNLRQRAKDLLENAKRAVEIAIEQDEQTAIDWLNTK